MALNHTVTGSVNYTIVGSPTIVDGVASGFSSSDYLQTATSLAFSQQTKIEIFTKITTSNSVVTGGIIGPRYGNSMFGIYIQGTRPTAMFFYENTNGIGVNKQNNSSVSLQPNTTYYIKAIYDLVNVTSTIMVSSDDINFSSDVLTLTDFSSWLAWTDNNPYKFGTTQSGSFNGSIDLNHTYIKVNGQAWFGVCPVEVKHLVYRTPVDYTVVGSPTITNGVVSGFSGSDRLTISNMPSGSFEGKIRAKLNSDATGYGSLFFLNSTSPNHRFYIENNAKETLADIRYYVYDRTSSSNKSYIKYDLDLKGKWVDYDFNYNDTTHEITINVTDVDNNTTLNTVTYSDVEFVGGNINIGYYWQTFQGSIDLNQTYIKVNGKLWFFHPATNYLVKDGKLVFADSGLYLSGPVNYTKVGSPTIVDGVVSGFSGNNHLTIDTLIPFETADTWEIGTAFVAKDSDDWQSLLAFETGLNDGVAIDIHPTNNRLYVKTDNGQLFLSNSLVITYDIRYYVKLKFTGTTYIFSYSLDNSTWIDYATLESSTKTTNSVVQKQSIGYSSRYLGREWLGSIDLNETYIKVNDTLWFYGKNYASQNIAPVPAGLTYGNTTTTDVGLVDMTTQAFTAVPGATWGKDE